MGLLGSAIGGGLGAAASIYGGMKASQAIKQVKRNLEDQRKENQNWYDRRYNEDATQRADAQRILAKTEEAYRARNRQAAGTAAVMGGTEESVAATKAANAQGLADAVSRIDVAAESRKDGIEQQYQQTDRKIQNQLNDMEQQRAAAIGQAAQGVAQAGASFGTAFDDYKNK